MKSFDRGIYILVGLVIAAFVPLVASSLFSLHRVLRDQGALITKNAIERVLAERLRYMDSAQASVMPIYAITGDPKALAEFEEKGRGFDEVAARLAAMEDSPAGVELIKRVRETSALMRSFVPEAVRMRERGASVVEMNEYFRANPGTYVGELRAALDSLVSLEKDELEAGETRIYKSVRRIVLELIFFTIVAVVAIIFGAYKIVQLLGRKRAVDQTRERLLNDERRVSNARKEAVEIVAHDLKSPLATVTMSLDLIASDTSALDGTDLAETVQIAQRSAASMNTLIQNVLDHAKIESGRLILERRPTDLNELTRDVIRRFQPQARGQRVNVILAADGPPTPVSCDPVRVDQVISNLISNALKFTAAGGEVRVNVVANPVDVQIVVDATGPGIPGEVLPHVFDRFWQNRETAQQGSGLGLAIAKSVAEAHDGTLTVSSEYGRGATFTLRLPRGPVVGRAAAPPPPVTPGPGPEVAAW